MSVLQNIMYAKIQGLHIHEDVFSTGTFSHQQMVDELSERVILGADLRTEV